MSRRNKSLYCVVVLCVLFCGCAAPLAKITSHKFSVSPVLDPKAAVLVVRPADGYYNTVVSSGSGMAVGSFLSEVFQKHVKYAEVSANNEELEAALDKAKNNSFSYLVYPVIKYWEDQNTDQTGLPDKVELRVELFDVESFRMLDSVVFSGKGSYLTFTEKHPLDLLNKPVKDYVASLFKPRRRK